MLYRISFVTSSQMTIEADSLDEAEQIMARQIEAMNSHSHHGEKTVASLQAQINVGTDEQKEFVWATLT